jgi:CBS domain-containing protein
MPRRKVREIMTDGAICQRAPTQTVRDACCLMADAKLSSVLVTDQGRLVGIFTERDAFRRVFARALDPDATRLHDVMTRDPVTITPDDSVADAIRRMDEFGYSHLPVVEGERVLGVLTLRDLSPEDLAAMHAELEYRRTFAERAW